FVRHVFTHPTPGAPNNGSSAPPPSFIPYLSAGSVYSQNFDSLPNPGATSAAAGNPVKIAGVTYSVATPFDFAYPSSASGNNGGLGLPSMAGWFGLAAITPKFGATDGDDTTGDDLSFGLPDSGNRALGLLSTSSTGATAFGAKFINGSGQTLNYINVQCTAEVWRQSNLGKTIECYYFIDDSATNAFSTDATGFLPALNITSPTVSGDVGGAAVDGTASANQTRLSVNNQVVSDWRPGAALWLVWEMTSSAGKSQGMGIDDLTFSATAASTLSSVSLGAQTSGTNLVLTWPGSVGKAYQVQYTTNLIGP